MKASHKEREALIGNQVVALEPGQFVTGRKSLTEEMNKGMKPKFKQSEISWWRYLNNLEKFEMLNIKKTNKYSVITINKWYEYQQTEQQVNNKRTSNEHQMNTNKNVKNDKNVNKKDYTSKIKDLLPVFSSIENFNQLNKKYWDAIRETRKTGSVSKSVIYNNMTKWQKYDLTVIEYALKTHVESHKGKKEDYTIGIMRNTSKEEAAERLRVGVKPFKNNVVQIPSYGGESDGKSNEQHSNEFGNVKLYK
ncbi:MULTISPECIES: hypothetical protein [unclassified Oceanobacillus]|uniref:hypothetical protein n=1 Tax=unclassified Oceanobacillus TaxID=2630292 RepID=UPI001BE60BF7|nr:MULTISPECIES: hypothetical protein [unclassified Oceanobacillus]MBT2601261.1 hypothetical protein [Oceanobacillus sp. ISL-74]MBT2653633.1 hypothetical protein [Oceanobacillus sp. ISL-73]